MKETDSTGFFHRKTFARRVWLVLLPLIILPVLIFSGLVSYQVQNLLKSQALDQMLISGKSQADHLDQWFASLSQALNKSSTRPETVAALDSLILAQGEGDPGFEELRENALGALEAANQDESLFSGFAVVSPGGKVLLASQPGWEGADLGETGYFADLAAYRGSRISTNPLPFGDAGVAVLTSTPLLSGQSDLYGYLIGVTDGLVLRRMLESAIPIPDDVRSYLALPDGEFIALNPEGQYATELEVFIPTPEQQAVLQEVWDRGRASDVTAFTSFDQQPVAASIHRLAAVNSLVVQQAPLQQPLEDFAPFFMFIATALLATVIALAGLSWIGIRSGAKPLRNLSNSLGEFTPGTSPTPVEIRTQDEIGQISTAYNQLVEELTTLYQSMDKKVDERARQVGSAVEIVLLANESTDAGEILDETVRLIVDRYGYYHAAVYLFDPAKKYAVLRHASGAGSDELISRGHRFAVGSNSVVGWVTSSGQARPVNNTSEDPIFTPNEFLPFTKSEFGIPLSARGEIFGALDIHSSSENAFSRDFIDAFQILADLTASTLGTIQVLDTAITDLSELSMLYQAGKSMIGAATEEEVNRVIASALTETDLQNAFYLASRNGFSLYSYHPGNADRMEADPVEPPAWIPISQGFRNLEAIRLQGVRMIDTLNEDRQFKEFQDLATSLGWAALAVLPITVAGELRSILMIGAKSRNQLTHEVTAPFRELIENATGAIRTLRILQESKIHQENIKAVSGQIHELAGQPSEKGYSATNFSVTLDRLRRIFHCDRAAVYLTGEDNHTLRLAASSGYSGTDGFQTLIPFGEGPVGIAASSQTYQVLGVSEDEFPQNGEQPLPKNGSFSVIATPMIYRGKLLGVLALETPGSQSPSDTDKALVNTLCDALALLIANDQLIGQQRVLFGATSRISRSAELSEVMRTTVQELGEILQANKVRLRIGVPGQGEIGGDEIAEAPDQATNNGYPHEAAAEG